MCGDGGTINFARLKLIGASQMGLSVRDVGFLGIGELCEMVEEYMALCGQKSRQDSDEDDDGIPREAI